MTSQQVECQIRNAMKAKITGMTPAQWEELIAELMAMILPLIGTNPAPTPSN